MNDSLRQALMQLLGSRYWERGGRAVVAPSNERELAQTLALLASKQVSLGPALSLSRGSFSELSVAEGQSATITAGAGVRLVDVEARASANDLSLGPLPPGAGRLTVAEYLEGPFAGLRVALGGRLEPIALALRGMLADGTSYTSHRSPRSAAGPDLKALFLGAEGRLGLVLEATLRLVPRCRHSVGRAFRFASAREATRALIATAEAGLSLDWACAHRTGKDVVVWWRLGSPTGAVLSRDETSLAKLCLRIGGSALPDGPDRPGSAEPCRELSWTQVEYALEAGAPLRLHRIAMESVLVQGAMTEGLPMDRTDEVRWPSGGVVESLAAAVDAARVLGGVR